MAIDKLPGTAIATDAITADQLATGSITVADIPDGEITAGKLNATLNLSTKTVTLPAASVTAHAASQLNDLTDVNTSGVANGKILKYNGSAWVIADDAGGPADTDALSEGSSNLYYTTARANSAIDSRVNASFINNLTIVADTATTLATGRTISGVTFDGSQNITLNTSTITENTNLYYTDARVKASTLTAGSLRGSVNNATVQYGSSYSGTPAQGSFFFDSLNAKLKVYDGSAFLDAVPAGGGGGGGGSTDANTTFRKYLYTIGSVGNAVSGKDDVIVTAGSFVTGYVYIIVSAGNTDFTAIGSANNTVGTQFTATGAGSGTGTASHKLNYVTDGTENVEVYVNGIKQIQGSANDYVATSGTSVNFVSNLAVNDEVEINVFELLTNSSNFASLTVDTSTLVVNGTTNRVGIGTATPLSALHVTNAIDGSPAVAGFHAGMSGNYAAIEMSGTDGGFIDFQDATDGSDHSGRIIYAHSDDSMIFSTAGAQRLFITSSGNVGIGTNNPDKPLTITANSGANAMALRARTNDDYAFIQFYNHAGSTLRGQIYNHNNNIGFTTGTDSSAGYDLYIKDGDGYVGIGTDNPLADLHVKGNDGLILEDDGTTNAFRIQPANAGGAVFYTGTASSHTRKMVIDSSGRLTIGSIGTDTTLSGGQPALQVTGSAFNGYMASVRRDSSQYASGIILAKSRSSVADNFTVLQDNDGIGGVIFIGDDGTDLDTYGATITAVVNGTPSNNNMPADLEFATNSGSASPTLNMKLTKDGVLEGSSNAEITTSPIRKHSNTISTNTTIATTENAIAGGPINVATGVTLTINGNFTVV